MTTTHAVSTILASVGLVAFTFLTEQNGSGPADSPPRSAAVEAGKTAQEPVIRRNAASVTPSGNVARNTVACAQAADAYDAFLARMDRQKNKTISVCASAALISIAVDSQAALISLGATCSATQKTAAAANYAVILRPRIVSNLAPGGDFKMLDGSLGNLDEMIENAGKGSAYPGGWAAVETGYASFRDSLRTCAASLERVPQAT